MEVDIPEAVTVKDLLAPLEISESRGAVVIIQGCVLKADDSLGQAWVDERFEGGTRRVDGFRRGLWEAA